MTGSGKSQFMAALFKGLQGGHGILLDVKHEYANKGLGTLVRGNKYIHKIGPLLDQGYNVVYQPMAWDSLEYDQIADLVYYRWNTVLYVEEGQLVIPQSKISLSFKRLITAGRARNATLWAVCLKPALIDKTITSQSTHHFIFKLFEDNDIKAVKAYIPDLETLMNQVTKDNHKYIYYNVNGDTPQVMPPIRIRGA